MGRPVLLKSLNESFMSKVKHIPNGCIVWIAARDSNGYGQFGMPRHLGGAFVRAHRLAYEVCHGQIPAGMVIDHLCNNKRCVNPDHLEAVTQKENCSRAAGIRARARTYCRQGHRYTDENTYFYPSGRRCKTCLNVRKRKYRAAEKAIA
jgi:hypothetical protein